MTLRREQANLIDYLYCCPRWSPLEIAEELGLTFRQVCNFIDRNCLRKMDIAVAKGIRKATRVDSYWVAPSQWPMP